MTDPVEDQAKLNELDKEEWWGVCRHMRPDIGRDAFERLWDEFIELKRSKQWQ